MAGIKIKTTQVNKKKAEKTKKRAAGYCRVSTKSDIQDGSYENQQLTLTDYIQKNENLEFVGLYGDLGKSGRSTRNRPEFNRLMDDCREGKIDIIYVKGISRFARNALDFSRAVQELTELGVVVVFLNQRLSTEKSLPLVLNTLAVLAENVGRHRSLHAKKSHEENLMCGTPAFRVSYGYYAEGKNHTWYINEEEADRVRAAFLMAGTMEKYPDILAALNEMEAVAGTNRTWKHEALVYMLSNVSYIGNVLGNKSFMKETEEGFKQSRNLGQVEQTYIEEHHEPIVSEALFLGVGELMDRHLLYSKKNRYSEEDLEVIERVRKIAEQEAEQYGIGA